MKQGFSKSFFEIEATQDQGNYWSTPLTVDRYLLLLNQPEKKEYLLKIANTSYFHLLWKKKKLKVEFQSHSFTERP